MAIPLDGFGRHFQIRRCGLPGAFPFLIAELHKIRGVHLFGGEIRGWLAGLNGLFPNLQELKAIGWAYLEEVDLVYDEIFIENIVSRNNERTEDFHRIDVRKMPRAYFGSI